MEILDGKKTSAQVREELRREVEQIVSAGHRPPHLVAILVGDNGASITYVNAKVKACQEIGFRSSLIKYPAEVSQGELLDKIDELNNDPTVDGFIVQLPLPVHIDEKLVTESIRPEKDVDGFHPQNVGALCIGKPGFVSCTPAGVIQLLKRSGIEIAGKECVVVGRSNIVGKPMALLLLRENGTVTVAHSRTKDLKEVTKRADILVVAVGRPKMITADYVKEGAVVIDVGIHRNEQNKLCGDVDFDSVEPVCGAITPVPGGVGPMTIAMLMNNCLESVSLQAIRG